MEKNSIQAENGKQVANLSNKEKVIALLKAIETGDTVAVGYVNADHYTQHNLTVGDGLSGFGSALAGLADYPEKARVNTVRAFEDGKIVEHWDNLMPYDGRKNPSGHTPFDGTITIEDAEKTAENKALVKQFVIDVLKGEHPERLTSYFNGNAYIQHNVAIADGLDGLGNALKAMAAQGVTMEYHKVHKVLGYGNFVLTISEGTFAGKPTSFYDLFRVENGKIAEHWDVVETIAPQSEWKHRNGKFGGLQ